MRLFADNTPALQRNKDDQLEALAKRVVEHVGSTLTHDEAVHLRKCARVRNRLLHADFSKAAGALLSVGVAIEEGKVHIVDLNDGSVRRVSDTSFADGGVFAWVLRRRGRRYVSFRSRVLPSGRVESSPGCLQRRATGRSRAMPQKKIRESTGGAYEKRGAFYVRVTEGPGHGGASTRRGHHAHEAAARGASFRAG